MKSPIGLIRHTPANLKNKKIIHENDAYHNGLFSKLFVLKSFSNLKNYIMVPKWAIFISSLFYAALLGVLIAAVCILLFSRRPGVYLEDCQHRSCAPGLNLKCINDMCQCKNDQFYLKKCIDKKTHSEFCQNSTQSQCKDGLICIGGKCQCNETLYWNGGKCLMRKTIRETCNGDQCLYDSFLNCDNQTKICICDNTR